MSSTSPLCPPSSSLPSWRSLTIRSSLSFGARSSTPSSSTKHFSTRTDALTVIESLNAHLPSSAVPAIPYEPSTSKPRIALSTGADPKSYECESSFVR